MVKVSWSLRKLLTQRKLFLRSEQDDLFGEIVYVCVDDGHPDGFPVGHVAPARGGGMWVAYARVRPYSPFCNDEVAVGLSSIEAGIRAILDHAHYGDIMAALDERESGAAVTYTAEMGDDQAAWFAMLDEPKGITHLGNGTVRFTSPAVAYLRSLPERVGCYVDNKDRIWLSGTSYQLTRER